LTTANKQPPERVFALRGQLTAESFAAGQRLHAGQFYGCVFPAIVAVFALAINSLGIYLASWEAWPVFLVGIGFPLAYLYARRRSLAHAFRQQPILALSQEGELTRSGLRMRSELGEVTIPWRFFSRVKANTAVLLLYEAPQSFVILPRSFFANDGEFKAAIECAHVWSRDAKTPAA
jgi:hypothetical protein